MHYPCGFSLAVLFFSLPALGFSKDIVQLQTQVQALGGNVAHAAVLYLVVEQATEVDLNVFGVDLGLALRQ